MRLIQKIRRFHRLHRRNGGNSLVMTLVAVGITGLIVSVMATMQQNNNKMAAKASFRQDMIEVRGFATGAIDCKKTAAQWAALDGIATPSACTGLTNLYDRNGSVLISKSQIVPTVKGKWTLRAQCNATGISIQAARVKPGVANPLTAAGAANFFADPITKVAYDWQATSPANGSNGADLFAAGAAPCSNMFGASNDVATCSAGKYMSGWDRTSNTPVCTTLPSAPPATAPNCPAGQVVTAMNFATGTTTCQAISTAPATAPSCPVGQVVSAMNFATGSATCVTPPATNPTSAPSCPAGQLVTGMNFATGAATCQQISAVTSAAGGKLFGGSYRLYVWNNACANPNPAASGCNCPAGFTAYNSFEWQTTCSLAVTGGGAPQFDAAYQALTCSFWNNHAPSKVEGEHYGVAMYQCWK